MTQTAPVLPDTKTIRRLLEELDLLHDAYESLQTICAASDVEASKVFAILQQFNQNFRRTLDSFGIPL